MALAHIFAHTRWSAQWAKSEDDALSRVSRNPVGVLICDGSSPEVNWRKLCEKLSGLVHPPQLILTSANADTSFWAEALNLGAYDVLAKPFDWDEVRRVVSLAWLNWLETEALLQEKAGRIAAEA